MHDSTLSSPRISPVDDFDEDWPDLNIFATLAKHRRLGDRINRFAGFFLNKGLLPPREREIVILRVGWQSRSVYEFGQHTLIGKRAGITDEEIGLIANDATDGWDRGDRDLIDLVDELCATNMVSDDLWARLSDRWSESELLELLAVAGFYRMMCGLLNAVDVQREPGTPGWPS